MNKRARVLAISLTLAGKARIARLAIVVAGRNSRKSNPGDSG